jgi:predicted helicase
MVVLGNPPYSISSLNRGEWIDKLLEDYKQGLHEKKLNIDDDYIKFIRFAQWRIEQTGYGILGFITNSSYLDGLTHRRMRECLVEGFSEIYILNLHGSSRRGERTPGNIKDENVFDIQQGVAIGIFIKEPKKANKTHVYYADMWGVQEKKYQTLFESDVDSTEWQELAPTAPYFFFVPKDFSLENEYSKEWSLRDIFIVWQNGLKTDRDELFFDFDSLVLNERMCTFFSKSYGDDFKNKYRIFPSSSFDIETRRKGTDFDEKYIRRCLYRPFDIRYVYYDTKLTSRPAYKVMYHILAGQNLSLITTRQTKFEFAAMVTTGLSEKACVNSLDINTVFPLYLYPADGEMQFGEGHRHSNLNSEFIKAVSDKLGLKFVEESRGDLEKTFGPEDIFNYLYGMFHSPTYRTRYAEFLKIDFPRLPLTSDLKLFRALAAKGAELVVLHLLESPKLHDFITEFPEKGDNVVEKVQYTDEDRRVWINKCQYFGGVPKEVLEFYIGGYQVCEKWLKDRKGRKLSYDDIQHYQKIVVALNETICLMAEIDKVIDAYGGWPKAFV